MRATAYRSWLKRWFRTERTFALRRTQPLFLELLEERTLLSTLFTVVNNGDYGAGQGNQGDLRYCITQANKDTSDPNGNVIKFDLRGTGVQTIHLSSALPALSNTVTLDGWSQGGADYKGAPLVVLDGSDIPNISGLTIQASKCVVRGLAFNDFANYGLVVEAVSANDWVYGCSFGVTANGLCAAPNGAGGVYLVGANTLLGTNADGVCDDAERNIISGNNGYGVIVAGSGNTLAGNLIGLGADGSTALGNAQAGVLVFGASNTIGGTAAGAGNTISANYGSGILIDSESATGNVVQGNKIGTDALGQYARGNIGDGVVVTDGAWGNTLGGSTAGARNVISGNSGAGVALGRFTAAGTDNRVLGNYLGVNAAGTGALGNGFEGLLINDGSSGEVIGGSDPGDGNVISGNGFFGLKIVNGSNNTVQGNLIGVLPGGMRPAPNQLGGVFIQSTFQLPTESFATENSINEGGEFPFAPTTENLIGGTTPGAGNLISGNAGPGILLSGAEVFGNTIAGNRIGTTAGGAPLGNAGAGVRLEAGASANTIGGQTPGSGNLIAYNAKGVVVADDDSTGDSILGNSIFGNAGLGIDLGDDGPTANGTLPSGPNNLQPSPVLLSAGNGRITGSLSAAADTTYRIELFSSPASGPAGQGQTFLGSVLATTDEYGRASFTFAGKLPAGAMLTATATDLDTNLDTGDTSEFSTNSPPNVAFNRKDALTVVNTGQNVSLDGLFTDPDSEQWVGTINFGDGSAAQPLKLSPNHTFVLPDHVYKAEGNYTILVTITDDSGASGLVSIPIVAFGMGIDPKHIMRATASPGGSASVGVSGLTATLFRDRSDAESDTASLLVGSITASEMEHLSGTFLAGSGTLANAFDIRAVDLTDQDSVTVKFSYPPGANTPTLLYFDSVSQSFKSVAGSTLPGSTVVIDSVNHTITLTLDASSTPRLSDLTGTVFAVEVPQTQATSGTTSPAAPPSPLSPPPPLSAESSSATTSTTAETATTATTTTTTTSTPFLATSLPSSSLSSLGSANSVQTASNSPSANGISAFSPFFVLVITAMHPGASGGAAEAGAGAESNVSPAVVAELLPLLNRLPRVPVAEGNTPPPDSGPSAVLSPSRAGLPEETDKPETPKQVPPPVAPPAANNLPPLGFQFHPGAPAPLGLAATAPSGVEESAAWFDEVLSGIFDRLTWHDNGREDPGVPVSPALAVLALCAGLAPHVVRPRKKELL